MPCQLMPVFQVRGNPVEAVTHPDPYPYYARLVQEKPFYKDETLGCWVASSAEVVKEVLTNPLASVRPSAEPVPRNLLDTPLADIFARLIRMNDGEIHRGLKPVVTRTLASVSPAQTDQLTWKAAQLLLEKTGQQFQPGGLTRFAFQLPVFVMASLLGISDDRLFQVTDNVRDYVKGVAATAKDSPMLKPSKKAAISLLETFNALQTANAGDLPEPGTNPLFHRFILEAKSAGCFDPAIVTANVIGFLAQTYDATAGLIGNSLVALASRPEVFKQVKDDSALLKNLLQEVLRYDPPVQNTRRFVVSPPL